MVNISSYEAVRKSKEARLLIILKTNNPYQLGNSFIKRMLTNKLYTGVVDYPGLGYKRS